MKNNKTSKKSQDQGVDLDDAFGDDDDVEYAESKPNKLKKKVCLKITKKI
jgi:hypothetical protein